MPKRTGDFNAWRLEKLSNPKNAASYLNAALEQSPDVFLDAVKDVIQARTVSTVARQAGVARESLYRSFSATGNPTLETLQSVLYALDLKISGVEPHTGASSTNPIPEAGGRPRGFHKSRRRRGVGGRSYHPGQLSLPYDTSSSVVVALVPSHTGAQVNLAKQHAAGAAVWGAGLVADVIPQSSFPPGFIAYAMRDESYATAGCQS